MDKQLDLLLVNPGNRVDTYQTLASEMAAVEPPVWCLILASFVRKHGYAVEILDANAEGLTTAEVARIAHMRNPRLAAILCYGQNPNASTQTMPAAGATAKAIKQHDPAIPVIMIGGHVAALPERTLREEACDFVATGEGAWTLVDLLDAGKLMTSVRGLCYRGESGREYKTAPAPNLSDLDAEVPTLPWDLIDLKRYRCHNWHGWGRDRKPYAALYTSLGCPYRCHFCLAAGTKVITADCRNKKIQDLRVGDKLIGWDFKTKRMAETEIVACGERIVNELLEVQTADGRKVHITGEHPVKTRRGWVNAADLTLEDSIWAIDPKDKVGFRMKHYNPMHNSDVVARVSATSKRKIASGEIVPFMCTTRGRKVIGAIAREKCLSERNPMKDPAVALAPELRERRSQLTKERWADEEQADALMESRLGTYRTGPDHHMWQGGKSEEDYSEKFTAYYRRKIKKRDNYTCQECGYQNFQSVKLTVHHIDYDKQNDDPCNWITLCYSCHGRVSGSTHGGNGQKSRDEWRDYFQAKMEERGECPHWTEVVGIERRRGTFRVYNFQCAPHNNYFAEYLLVHNCCIQAPFKEGDRIGLNVVHGLQVDKAPVIVQHEQHYGKANSYRLWSPKTVVGWIESLVHDYGVTNIKVADEMFVLNRRHVEGICDLLIERGLGAVLNMWAYARVDTCNDAKLLAKMRRAGFRWIALGIESADPAVRDGVAKGYKQDIKACVNRVKDAGIHVGANYIFGLPNDTHESMDATFDLACELNTPYANFYSVSYYPGSQLWNEHPEVHNLPWSAFAQFGQDFRPMPTADCTAVEVLKFREYAWQTYYQRPAYLDMMRREFGNDVVEEVKKVGQTPLRYNILEGQGDGSRRPETAIQG